MARMTVLEALNAAMAHELERDPDVVILGQDVGRVGGIFRVTQGLQQRFGSSRVIDTPLDEKGIAAHAIGMALFIVLAAVASALTVLGYFLAPLSGIPWMVITNRTLALFAIWITAILLAHRKQSEYSLRQARDGLEVRVAERTRQLSDELAARTAAEEALGESEARSRVMIENLADGAITIGADGIIEAFNPAAERIFGYSLEEAIGKNVSILMPEPDRSAHDGYIERYLRTGDARIIGIGREVTGRCKDGTEFPLDIAISEMQLDGRTLFQGTVRDMTERKRIEQNLVDAKQSAEMASRVKTDFLANMSHELRTPLNAIIGFADSMRHEIFGSISNHRYREYLDHIHGSGQHLLELINDVLDVSVIESGKLEMREEQLDVARVSEASLRLVRSRAEQGEVRLIDEVDDSLPALHADERRVKQILVNMLSNAIKFTPEGGTVTLDARIDEAGTLTFGVTDTGIGMTRQEIAQAREPFGQVDSELGRTVEGTGLGLPLTIGLVEAHGGTLEIRSRRNRGTTVAIRFPAERVVKRSRQRRAASDTSQRDGKTDH